MHFWLLLLPLLFQMRIEAAEPAKPCANSGCDCATDELGRLGATCHVTGTAFPANLPKELATLHVFCDTLKDTSGRPVVDMKLLTRIPDKSLQAVPALEEVVITGCPVSELPPMLFGNLTRLRRVTLDSLLLVRLHGSLFLRSPDLEALQIINMADLTSVDPVLLHSQRRLHTVTLKRMNISGAEVASMIQPLKATLKSFTWSLNFGPVTLPTETFRGFSRLTRLDLRKNNLQSLDFLLHTRTQALILEKNPQLATSPPFDFTQCRQLRDLVELDMRATNLRHVGREFAAFRFLQNLFLGDNHLTVVPEVIYTRLNHSLERLDLSNNRIQVFPKAMQRQFHNPRFEAVIDGNPVHCNCESKWLFNFPTYLRDLRCHSVPEQAARHKGRLLMQLKPADLQCEAPTIPTIIVKNAVSTRSNFYGIRASALASSPDETVIRYNTRQPVSISRGQTLILRCDSSGDPAPELFWDFPGKFTLKRQPDPDRTLFRNLIEAQINHAQVSRFREAKFVCRATNEAGSRSAFVVLKNMHPTDTGDIDAISTSVTAQPSKKGPGDAATATAPVLSLLTLCLALALTAV